MEDGTHFVLVHKIEVFVLLGWKVAQKNTFDSYFPNPCCHDDILAILSCDTMWIGSGFVCINWGNQKLEFFKLSKFSASIVKEGVNNLFFSLPWTRSFKTFELVVLIVIFQTSVTETSAAELAKLLYWLMVVGYSIRNIEVRFDMERVLGTPPKLAELPPGENV